MCWLTQFMGQYWQSEVCWNFGMQIMIGILFFLFEFFDDQLLAFMVLTLVWLCELFTMIRLGVGSSFVGNGLSLFNSSIFVCDSWDLTATELRFYVWMWCSVRMPLSLRFFPRFFFLYFMVFHIYFFSYAYGKFSFASFNVFLVVIGWISIHQFPIL